MKTLFLLLATVFLISGCDKEIPAWNGKLYVGMSKYNGIVRSQDPVKPIIQGSDPAINGFVCMSEPNFKSFIQVYVVNCNSWSSNMQMREVSDNEVRWLYGKR